MGEEEDIRGIFESDFLQDPFEYVEQTERKLDLLFETTFNGLELKNKTSSSNITSSTIKKVFQWNYHGERKISVRLSEDEYIEWSREDRRRKLKRELAETNNLTIRRLANDLYTKIRLNNFNKSEAAHYVLSFVQYLPYSKAGKHPKHPIETLWEQKGNCIDFSILAASILSLLNYDVAVLSLREENHAMLGICGPFRGTSVNYEGNEYYFAETTRKGAKIGKTSRNTSRTDVTPINRK